MMVLSRLAPARSLSRTNCASVRIFLLIFRCAIALLCICTSGFSTFVQSSVVDGASLSTASSDVSSRLRMELYRSSFHFQPAKNWMNDPNGPMFYKGLYHLFYQYNPAEPVWGNLTWGHAVSEDLIHWEDLEPALTCDHWYDVGGVWSGSATIRPDGTPMILYTGVAADLEETQNIAVPANASDPYLRDWVKLPENPVLRHPAGIDKEDFRDPSTAWQLDDGSWRMTLGARLGKDNWGQIGMALLYRSDDLLHWELEKNVLRALPQTGMWECVDFFPVGSSGKIGLDTSSRGPAVRHILKVSSFVTKRDYYAVGFYNKVTETFAPLNGELDVIYGLLYDYGKFYASKSFFDPKKLRRINWGWSNESDTEAQDIAKGWASLLAIPRTMWLDSKLGDNLLQAPIEEVKSLRGDKVSRTDVDLETGSVLKIDGSSGGQLDIEVVFEYPDVSKVSPDEDVHPDTPFDCSKGGSAQQGVFGPFGLLVMADDALIEQTAVFFYISQSKAGRWATHFCSDQSRSSLLDGVDSSTFWGTVRVLPSEDFLSLRVLVDHSIVESFVQEGRMAVTSRVYPTKAIHEQAHVFLFNNGTSPITVREMNIWKMRGVWTTPDSPVGNPKPFNPKPFNPKPFNGAKK